MKTDTREEILQSDDHLLIRGGPGSGKTTVSTMKAGKLVQLSIQPGQRVLFLSFARVTISRVVETLRDELKLASDIRKRIQIDTYHAFFWRFLKTHGYLLGLPRRLRVLTPANEAVQLAQIRSEYKKNDDDAKQAERKDREAVERRRLAYEEGLISFDLFGEFVLELLSRGPVLTELVSKRYPYLILDEFQDTDAEQWEIVKALGRGSQLIALADEEQRIYDFRGADPQRLDHYRESFNPTEFDFGGTNHRSGSTEIALFANDMLKGEFTKDNYDGVVLQEFAGNENQARTALTTTVLEARERLSKDDSLKDWSLAVLVPTKQMTRRVSDYFRERHGQLPTIPHKAVVEIEAALLAAEVVAFALSGPSGDDEGRFFELVENFHRGRLGDQPNVSGYNTATQIEKRYQKAKEQLGAGKRVAANNIALPMIDTFNDLCNLKLSGVPDEDWKLIVEQFANSESTRLTKIAEDIKNLRLLDRGTQLRQALTLAWRDHSSYEDSEAIVQSTFVDDYLANSGKKETGIVLMNMHKAKGKQFDEVIIFEGWPRRVRGKIVANPDRIVRSNISDNIDDQCKQNFRVSITRAMQRSTILTPANDHCLLLHPQNPR